MALLGTINNTKEFLYFLKIIIMQIVFNVIKTRQIIHTCSLSSCSSVSVFKIICLSHSSLVQFKLWRLRLIKQKCTQSKTTGSNVSGKSTLSKKPCTNLFHQSSLSRCSIDQYASILLYHVYHGHIYASCNLVFHKCTCANAVFSFFSVEHLLDQALSL